MNKINKDLYRNLPFYNATANSDSYAYSDLKDLADKCSSHKYDIIKCRTIGIIQSLNGRFYLSDIGSPSGVSEPIIQVSVVYLKSPPQSTVIPYPVQVFGTMQWKNRPVLFTNILQVLNVPTAIRIRNALSNIVARHSAIRPFTDDSEEEILCGDLTVNELDTTFTEMDSSEVT